MSLDSPDQYNVWRDYYLVIQGFFYFAQGIAMGALFFITGFLGFLGVDDFNRIVFQAVIWLPWYLKIIFGILSDNVPISSWGRRKPYLLIAGVLGVIGWIWMGTFTAFSSLLLFAGILASFGTSMSDATIDALAVDITPPEKRGAMQGVSWGSRGIGVGAAAVAWGLLAEANQWFIIYAIPGVIVSLSCFLILLFKENPIPEDFSRNRLGVYSVAFKRRLVVLCIVFNILAGAGIAILSIMQTLLEVGLGFDFVTIGIVFLVFSIGMFIGAVMFGIMGDKVAVRITLPLTAILYTLVILSAIFLDLTVFFIAMAFFFIVGFANGGYEATQMRISMDNSAGPVGGTLYNFYNSISNLGQLALGAILIAAFTVFAGSYQIGWQLAWVFLLLSIIPGYFLVKDQKTAEAEEELILPD